MVRRSAAMLSLLVGPVFVMSCADPDTSAITTSTGAASDCLSIEEAVVVANASNRGKLAKEGVDVDSLGFQYGAETSSILACDGGIAVLETALVDSNGEPAATEFVRYLLARASSGDWYDAANEYFVFEDGQLVGVDCQRLPPKVAAHHARVVPGEPVTYANRACANAAPSTNTRSTAQPIAVGEVPGRPAAAAALQAWADDLAAGDAAVLVRKCWTIAPERVRSMYADSAAIERAIAQPGIDGQFAYVWQNATTRVSVKRSEIASGYACPYVSPQSDVHIYNAADARHLVMRYLLRNVGSPMNVDDTEVRYPLECTGWGETEMSDASKTVAATVTSFDPNSIAVAGGPYEWQVVVQGESAGGEDREYRYLTSIGHEGPCISEAA